MTKPERLLAVVGVGVVAAAVLLVMYVRSSNPADAQANGCAAQRERLSETLDQVRFSKSASLAISTALEDTGKTRNEYAAMISGVRRQLDAGHLPAQVQASIQRDLGKASGILSDQDESLRQAQATLVQAERELSSAMPIVSQASQDLGDSDCTALSLTMSSSGWPKDRMLSEMAEAARINSQASDKLDAALGLILDAQHQVRAYSIAAK